MRIGTAGLPSNNLLGAADGLAAALAAEISDARELVALHRAVKILSRIYELLLQHCLALAHLQPATIHLS